MMKPIHPPTLNTTGLPVEESESEKQASADVRPYLEKADEPGEAQHESNWAKTGYNKGTTVLVVGLHFKKNQEPGKKLSCSMRSEKK